VYRYSNEAHPFQGLPDRKRRKNRERVLLAELLSFVPLYFVAIVMCPPCACEIERVVNTPRYSFTFYFTNGLCCESLSVVSEEIEEISPFCDTETAWLYGSNATPDSK
jgi:hypothetical protein